MAAAFRTVAGAIGLALLAAGCASIPGLRDGLGTGQAEIQRCLAQTGGPPRSLQDCTAKSGPELARLSRSAFDQAQSASTRTNKVSYYLFAAQAGWESAQPDGLSTADTALQAGTAECDQFGPNEFRPPRDCALLRVGPAFVAHVRTLNTLARLEAQSALGADDKAELADTSGQYARRTFDFVESRRKEFEGSRELDSSVIAVLDRQRTVFFCTALHISTLDRRFGDADSERKVIADRRRMVKAVPSLQRQNCKTT